MILKATNKFGVPSFARWAVCPLTLTQRAEFMRSSENAIAKLRKLKVVMTREGKPILWNLPARIEFPRSLDFVLRSCLSLVKSVGSLPNHRTSKEFTPGKNDLLFLPINMTENDSHYAYYILRPI